ncbi:MAG: hypothetical protein ACM3U1_06075 [Chloroflexota bacterium]
MNAERSVFIPTRSMGTRNMMHRSNVPALECSINAPRLLKREAVVSKALPLEKE